MWNMNKYKILKILIIIFMILCILIGIVYLIFSNGNSLSPYERKSTPENEEMFIEENSEVLEKVKYRYHYYTIQLLIRIMQLLMILIQRNQQMR